MEDSSEDLDSSWIEQAEFQDNYQRELMKDISIFFIYIDTTGSIELIIKEQEIFEDNVISKEKLLQIIQSKRHRTDKHGKKYRLIDLLSFHVPLEPEHLKDFINSEDSLSFLKSLPIFDNVSLEPSIFIFHDLNSLFFLFKEVEAIQLKSILKSGHSEVRSTKKVRMNAEDYIERKKKSLKRMLHKGKMTRKNL